MDRLNYILLGHALPIAIGKGQAITTRYFAKKQNELKHPDSNRDVLSFVQL